MLKTPLPTLLLLILALVCFGREKLLKKGGNTAVTNSSLLIPALGYFAIALTTDINLGYRHLLPVLPFLFIFVAAVLVPGGSQLSPKQFILPGALITWLAITTVAIYPHYIAFFNRLAGGPDGGWRYLVDSNIDWGQDLAGLKTWLDANGVDRVWLSYFGEARPDYYNINHIGLDSFPPRLMNPQTRPFYPYNPAPGIYAISATNLQGVQFADHDLFAWFRDKKPVAKIGYSIFIYDVPAHGEPIDLALGSIQLDEIMSEDFVRLGTNDVTLHWFDAATSLLWPTDGATWLVKAGDTTAHPFLNSLLPSPVVQNDEYALYQLVWSTTDDIGLTSFNNGAGVIRLVESQLEEETAVPGKSITIHSQFYNQSPPQPVKIYLHLINHNGAIVAQWDGLGAAWEGWREGDLLWQKHQMTIPTDTQPGVYHLKIGLYHPETGQRWLTPDDHDFFTAGTIKVAK
jgi:hypothetical protein